MVMELLKLDIVRLEKAEFNNLMAGAFRVKGFIVTLLLGEILWVSDCTPPPPPTPLPLLFMGDKGETPFYKCCNSFRRL